MGMSIETGVLMPQLSSYRFVQVYSHFLHTTTAPAVMAIITTSRTISGQLILRLGEHTTQTTSDGVHLFGYAVKMQSFAAASLCHAAPHFASFPLGSQV